MENLVLLDFGSNSVRLSINEICDDGTVKEVKRDKRMSRLAEGMGVLGNDLVLSQAAQERTLRALTEFKKEYEHLPNLRLKGIATAAVRNAKNSAAFLKRVKDLTGVTVEILSGEKEAYYDYLGVKSVLGIKDCLIIDMGGGSFELVLMKDGLEVNGVSIPFGAVSLSERFNLKDKIYANDLFSFEIFLTKIFQELFWLKDGKDLPIVLLGGANRTIARYELHEEHFGQGNVHALELSAQRFLEIYTHLLSLDCKGRKKALKEEGERADIIIGGLTPLAKLVLDLNIPELIFSETGIREGIIYSLKQDGQEADGTI